jgi:eukaryotic-like serine/threonine-protein kinase
MTNRIVTKLTFDEIREIGSEGANSKTILAYDPQLNTELAVKYIPKNEFKNAENYFLEAQMLYSSKHPNIMTINYSCEDDENIYLSMPFFSNGSLNSIINSRFLSVREIIRYSLDFLSGLHFIHSKRLIHFDLKPTNILINDANKAILTDFGLAKYLDEGGFARPEKFYRKHYAPEAFVTMGLTSQYDIYQVGLTIYRMCNGNPEFEAQSRDLTQEKILDGTFPLREKFLPHIPASLRKCIKKALAVNPDQRYLTVLDLMNDLSDIDEMLDWYYSTVDEKTELWTIENGNTIKTVSLENKENIWSVSGFATSKRTGRQTRITKCSFEYVNKIKAYEGLKNILKGF